MLPRVRKKNPWELRTTYCLTLAAGREGSLFCKPNGGGRIEPTTTVLNKQPATMEPIVDAHKTKVGQPIAGTPLWGENQRNMTVPPKKTHSSASFRPPLQGQGGLGTAWKRWGLDDAAA